MIRKKKQDQIVEKITTEVFVKKGKKNKLKLEIPL